MEALEELSDDIDYLDPDNENRIFVCKKCRCRFMGSDKVFHHEDFAGEDILIAGRPRDHTRFSFPYDPDCHHKMHVLMKKVIRNIILYEPKVIQKKVLISRICQTKEDRNDLEYLLNAQKNVLDVLGRDIRLTGFGKEVVGRILNYFDGG